MGLSARAPGIRFLESSPSDRRVPGPCAATALGARPLRAYARHMRHAAVPVLSGEKLFGHVAEMRSDRMSFIRRLGSECRDMMRVRFFSKTAYFVGSPALLHEVFVDKAKSFGKTGMMRYMLYPVAGEGLFTSNGALWRQQRKLMAPLFTQRDIARYAGCMVDCALRGASTWGDGETVDMARETMRITMSIAGRALFEAETFDEADALGAALTVALDWASHNAANPVPLLQNALRRGLEDVSGRLPSRLRQTTRDLAGALHGPVLLPTPRARRLQAAVRVLDERVQRMIDERRASPGAHTDLLTRLLSARDEDDGSRMSDKQVRDEVLTLFIAGHETTATALAWALYLLARHPDALRRVQAEIDALGGRPPTFEDYPRLAYTLQVFKETLRLYPPVYFFSREAMTDVDVAGHVLPRGTVVFFSPFATHRRPDLWKDPERFDPERFRPEAEGSRPRLSWFPFGAGPRVCIGNHFALVEGTLVLATLLGKARFELVRAGEADLEPSATLRPRDGMPMRIHRRQPQAATARVA
jgi:cytochrome P450